MHFMTPPRAKCVLIGEAQVIALSAVLDARATLKQYHYKSLAKLVHLEAIKSL